MITSYCDTQFVIICVAIFIDLGKMIVILNLYKYLRCFVCIVVNCLVCIVVNCLVCIVVVVLCVLLLVVLCVLL